MIFGGLPSGAMLNPPLVKIVEIKEDENED
jgi:hypothetical protein